MKSKKMLIVLCAVAVVLLMVSSATAVPQTNSETVMEKLNKKSVLMEKLEFLKEKNAPLGIGLWLYILYCIRMLLKPLKILIAELSAILAAGGSIIALILYLLGYYDTDGE